MRNLLPITSLIAALLITTAATFVGAGYGIGDTVEDFTLINVDEEEITFSEYLGEGGAVVIFTCNTCPWAVGYQERIVELHNKLSNKGWPILAINPNDPSMKPGDSFAKMKQRSVEAGFTFPYLMDKGQTVFPAFGATKTPHVFVVDRDMKVRYMGGIDDSPQDADGVEVNYIESAIEAIEAGNEPSPTSTKAIGCGIKYRKR